MKVRMVIDTVIDVDEFDPDWEDYRDTAWQYFKEHINDYAMSKDVSYDVVRDAPVCVLIKGLITAR